ncbi:MAG: hypothetical protein ACR2MD_02085 [Aridibacter sp.]
MAIETQTVEISADEVNIPAAPDQTGDIDSGQSAAYDNASDKGFSDLFREAHSQVEAVEAVEAAAEADESAPETVKTAEVQPDPETEDKPVTETDAADTETVDDTDGSDADTKQEDEEAVDEKEVDEKEEAEEEVEASDEKEDDRDDKKTSRVSRFKELQKENEEITARHEALENDLKPFGGIEAVEDMAGFSFKQDDRI